LGSSIQCPFFDHTGWEQSYYQLLIFPVNVFQDLTKIPNYHLPITLPPPQRIAIVPLCSSRTILARPSELSRSTLSDSEGLANTLAPARSAGVGHIAGMSPRCEPPIAHLAEFIKDPR
jgi:hypothetical protein